MSGGTIELDVEVAAEVTLTPMVVATVELSPSIGTIGRVGLNWRGGYSDSTAYAVDDAVAAGGSSFICIAPTMGNNPLFTSGFWDILALQGLPGEGDFSAVVPVSIASATWVISVPAPFIAAGKVPAATVYDTAGTQLNVGVVHDPTLNTLTLTFSSATAGTVSLN